MAASLATIRSRGVEILNMSSPGVAFGTIDATVAETWSKTAEYDASIIARDSLVCIAIINNFKHPERGGFLTSASVAHLGTIAAHVGEIEAVIINGKRATIPMLLGNPHPDPCAEIERERTNALTLTLIEPHYALMGSNILCHNGSSNATVHFCGFTPTSVCQAPAYHEDLILWGMLADMFGRDGHRVDAAGFYDGLFQTGIQAISAVGQQVAA